MRQKNHQVDLLRRYPALLEVEFSSFAYSLMPLKKTLSD